MKTQKRKRIAHCETYAQAFKTCAKIAADLFSSPIEDRKELIESLAKDEIPWVLGYIDDRFPDFGRIRKQLRAELRRRKKTPGAIKTTPERVRNSEPSPDVSK